jgi:hypothetical protein
VPAEESSADRPAYDEDEDDNFGNRITDPVPSTAASKRPRRTSTRGGGAGTTGSRGKSTRPSSRPAADGSQPKPRTRRARR